MRRHCVDLRAGLVLSLFAAQTLLAGLPAVGHETGEQHVHFQKPSRSTASTSAGVTFRSASAKPTASEAVAPPTAPAAAQHAAPTVVRKPSAVNPLRQSAGAKPSARPINDQAVAKAAFSAPTAAAAPRIAAPRVAAAPSQRQAERIPTYVAEARRPAQTVVRRPAPGIATRQGRFTSAAASRAVVEQTGFYGPHILGGQSCDCGEPTCGICEPSCEFVEPGCGCTEPSCGIVEPGCGCAEPSCGIVEPGCGIVEPGCGCTEPSCGIVEPGCGIVEPSCGCDSCGDGVGCGSCVSNGPDYWCFPVCLPRLKELRFWGGVHGFKGPRDAPAFGGNGDGNFGFQEGINIAGRPPLIHQIFPGIAYQLGYQAVQSQLSGNSGGSANDRSQNFVTAGLFRRVRSGLQFGAVWDYQSDDFLVDTSLQQVRYEISLKSPRGREIGFWGASHVNSDSVILPTNGLTKLQTVDQYCGFIRWNFQNGGNVRIWGGGTNDDEGLFGADWWFPANDRWSIQSGFNYLITGDDAGTAGAQEEAWNVAINVYWHWGARARKNCGSPFQPLFNVADNGTMFVDQAP